MSAISRHLAAAIRASNKTFFDEVQKKMNENDGEGIRDIDEAMESFAYHAMEIIAIESFYETMKEAEQSMKKAMKEANETAKQN